MSDPLPLVRRLGRLDDDALTTLLVARQAAPRELRDFFDLAEALLEPASVRQALRTLPRGALEQLADGSAPEAGAELLELALLIPDAAGTPTVPVSVADTARAVLAEHPVADARPADDDRRAAELPDSLVGTARERAFTAISAVAELVQQLRLAPARVRARGGVTVAEEKRLAPALSVPTSSVGPLVQVAEAAGLVAVDGEELLSTEAADAWSALSPGGRWLALAEAWLDALDSPLPAHLRAVRRTDAAALVDAYPAADESLHTSLIEAAERGELLGVWAAGRLTAFGRALFLATGAEALDTELPPEVDRVYLQHDLSLIAPGPLSPALDARLRLLADLENHGVASAYRVSQQTIDRALSSGETEQSLRAFLEQLSLTGIPQAVDYLLGEGARRHGLVRVRERAEYDRVFDDGTRTMVSSDDAGVLAALAADQALSALALRPAGAATLTTRAAPAAAYWLLLDARYPVLAEDASGAELVMRRARVLAAPPAERPASATTPAVTDLVLRLRDAARRSAGGAPAGRTTAPGDEPTAEGPATAADTAATDAADAADADARAWTARRLDRAVRARTPVSIEVRMPDGGTTRLDVVPLSLANGRLRVSDERAGVERTVPVANIVDLSAL
ncbi:helicase-associated domain-containing protein [Herbiconiux liangxiaofengii]|uniref:helicase-associated domain-containing protein n=1 Tax=Herbiconiux liangxiaofengii TaxID=3342795 RepID=UPI0035B7A72C